MIKISKVLPCELVWKKNGKLYCKIHEQYLMYIYRYPGNTVTFSIACTDFEDQLAAESNSQKE